MSLSRSTAKMKPPMFLDNSKEKPAKFLKALTKYKMARSADYDQVLYVITRTLTRNSEYALISSNQK